MTLPWMAERIQLRAIASLRPHAGNARVHDAAQLAQIMASMQAFGFTKSQRPARPGHQRQRRQIPKQHRAHHDRNHRPGRERSRAG
jgi:hypothetical protein